MSGLLQVAAGGTLRLLARVASPGGEPLKNADVLRATYTVLNVDEDTWAPQGAVVGFDGVAMPTGWLSDTLLIDSDWTLDSTGYNVQLQCSAFSDPSAAYQVNVTIETDAGPVVSSWYVFTMGALIAGKYTSLRELCDTFGFDNVSKWAQVSSDAAPPTMLARVDWAAAAATNHINAMLAEDFDTPFSPAPPLVRMAATYIAGSMLYDARGIADVDKQTGESLNLIAPWRKRGERIILDIVAGVLSLDDSLEGLATFPQAVREHEPHRAREPEGLCWYDNADWEWE